MKHKLSHVDRAGNPQMVDVSGKQVTRRTARAEAIIFLGRRIVEQMQGDELITKKGPVFQTAIIAGVMAAKKTHELVPFCHPLALEDCQVTIKMEGEKAVIQATAVVTARTGVEMEALTAVSIAALTVYDMCKALSHEMVIEQTRLLTKRGGKKDFDSKQAF